MRTCTLRRKTQETDITVKINLDGSGRVQVSTGFKFFDHMLSSLGKHGRIDLEVKATGDLSHHVIEDVGICIGQALDKVLADRRGIARMGDAVIPMDDALVLVAVDLSGRAYSDISLKLRKKRIEDVSSDILKHFLDTFAKNGRFNLHIMVLKGENDHHKVEAAFKALGIALKKAVQVVGREVPSTKGVL